MTPRSGRLYLTALWLLIGALSLAPALVGCGVEDSPSPAGLGSAPPPSDGGGDGGGGDGGDGGVTAQPTVTLGAAQPATVTAGSSASTFTVTVLDGDGAAVDGGSVLFSVTPSSVAQLSAASALTDAAGQASVSLTGRAAGVASVTASYQGQSSSAQPVTVVAPTLSIATNAGSIDASAPGSGGAQITLTVTDHLGGTIAGLGPTFSTTLGQLSSVTTPAAGQYRVTLSSTEAGTAVVTAAVPSLGLQSSSVQVVVAAGDVASLQLTPSPSQIRKAPNSTSQATIAIVARDAFDNPVPALVDLVSSNAAAGSLAEASVTLNDQGQGQVTFSAGANQAGTTTVTASVGGTDLANTTIQVVIDASGEPANILISVDPPNGKITVAGVGSDERATITVQVVDVNGDPIESVASNLEMEITQAPGNSDRERPFLDGEDAGTGVLTLTTNSATGIAIANLQAGTRPGTVEVEVRVIRSADQGLLVNPLTAVVPEITIEAGPPFSLFLGRANAIDSPGSGGQGTITHDYLAILSDKYGNAVPDGTAVFFGQFKNIIAECRQRTVFDAGTNSFVNEDCADASVTAGTGVLTSASGQFLASPPVNEGDTLALISEFNEGGFGGYTVDSVDNNTQVTLETALVNGASGMEYAIGNNGNLGGAVLSPGATLTTTGGVARWPNTYSGEFIGDPVYIFAETQGRGLGHAREFAFSGLAPTVVDLVISGTPDELPPGGSIGVGVAVEDSSPPTAYRYADTGVLVSASGGTLAPVSSKFVVGSATSLFLETSSRQVTVNDPGGAAGFQWTAPGTAVTDDKFKIIITANETTEEINITIK